MNTKPQISTGNRASLVFSYEQEVGFSEEDIGLKQFREVGTMVAALKNGKLGPAKEWVLRPRLASF